MGDADMPADGIPDALTYEVRHPAPLIYRGHVHRAWWIASADTWRHIGYFGWKAVAPRVSARSRSIFSTAC
jgi:hypothetical protein